MRNFSNVTAKRTELQPNEKTEINVEMKADSIYEKFDKTIYIQTDDPSNPASKNKLFILDGFTTFMPMQEGKGAFAYEIRQVPRYDQPYSCR